MANDSEIDIKYFKYQLVRITRAMIQGRLNLLEGCLLIAPLCTHFDTNENQELIIFIVVAEELEKLKQRAPNLAAEVASKDPSSDFVEPLKSIFEIYNTSTKGSLCSRRTGKKNTDREN